MGVTSDLLDANGNFKDKDNSYSKIKTLLAAQGIKLKVKTQPDKNNEKSTLEFLIDDHTIDWVIARNSGAELDEEIYEKFSSLGVISKSPFLFFVKAGNKSIKKIKDLRGRKIAFRAAPEGNERPVFTSDGAIISPYSANNIIKNFFQLAGITSENTKLINIWPDQITENGDWDVFIVFGFPSAKNSSKGIYPAILKGGIEFLQFEDMEAIAKNLPYLAVQKLPASGMLASEGIPNADVRYLSTTVSVFAKSNLDHTLVMILSEALKKIFSEPSIVREKDEFPNFKSTETFKANPVAEEFYKSGRPILGKYFPLIIAGFVMNLLVIMVPALTVIFPVVHYFPSLYRIYIRRKVAPLYKQLEFIDKNSDVESDTLRDKLKIQLHDVETRLRGISLPFMYGTYVQEIFNAMGHAELVKSKLYKR